MGEIWRISCKECGRDWECRTGCGFRHGQLSAVVQEFLPDIQKKIQADTSSNPLALYDFGYRTVGCPHCRNMVSVPVLEMKDTGHIFVGLCPQCNGVIRQEELADEICCCPACHSGGLSVEPAGLWD